MARYKNPWYSPSGHDPEYYETDVAPREYRGYLIYQRLKGICWDVVKDGVVVAQRAGDTNHGLNKIIDQIIEGGGHGAA